MPFRLGIVGNGTLDLVVPALEATAVRYGILLECLLTPYGHAVQDALSPDSAINRAECDAVLMALDSRGVGLTPAAGDAERGRRNIEAALELVQRMEAALTANGKTRAIAQTLACPPETLFGSLDRLVPGTAHNLIYGFNAGLISGPGSERRMLLDVAALVQTIGSDDWYSPTQWNMAKLPFAADCIPIYAEHVCRLLGASKGHSRRALILDLDNTLWGGVIGDDGMEGIVLGEGDGTGEAFLSVQRLAHSLRQRGIVLAVSSKNTDAVARQAFREHPEMLLRESDIAVFQANWEDKPTNIRAIADELALGLDAMVFLDDNPAERALVRSRLPDVAVPELPDDPSLYARFLAAAGYFEAIAFSAEDRLRAEAYRNNAERAELGRSIGDVEQFLASLDMQISYSPFDAANRPRIVQLINKSNQFNLTTRRYSEGEVRALEQDDTAFTLQIRLSDRFGDNGMISVVICRAEAAGVWRIECWLMSCRVLGRGVERLVLRRLIQEARARDIEVLLGDYLPSGRNELVRDHYARLGFDQVGSAPDGTTQWSLPTSAIVTAPPARVVVRERVSAIA